MARKLQPTVKSIKIDGISYDKERDLIAATDLSVGQPYTKVDIETAASAIARTDLVERVRFRGIKTGHLIFIVKPKAIVIVDHLAVRGNRAVKTQWLFSAFSVRAGSKLDEKDIQADVMSIRGHYERRHKRVPIINVERTLLSDSHVDITYVIDETRSPLDADPESIRVPKKRRRANRIPDTTKEEMPSAGAVTEVGDAVHISSKASGSTGNGRASEKSSTKVDTSEIYSDSWTGRASVRVRARQIRNVVPIVMSEIDVLVDLVEAQRFNDPETDAALQILRSLHDDLGDLIEAVESKKDKPILIRIARKNAKLIAYTKAGAKIGAIAPAMTIGVTHLLSFLTNVPIDSSMVSTVFGSMVALQILPEVNRNDTRSAS